MSPNEIKRIINVVVDYGWPFLIKLRRDENGKLTGEEDRFTVLNILLDYIRTHDVRLDPNHEWDWPVETREGMPCWAHLCTNLYEPFGFWQKFDSLEHARSFMTQFNYCSHHEVVPHPLNPTMQPPAGWSPEGKRILK